MHVNSVAEAEGRLCNFIYFKINKNSYPPWILSITWNQQPFVLPIVKFSVTYLFACFLFAMVLDVPGRFPELSDNTNNFFFESHCWLNFILTVRQCVQNKNSSDEKQCFQPYIKVYLTKTREYIQLQLWFENNIIIWLCCCSFCSDALVLL